MRMVAVSCVMHNRICSGFHKAFASRIKSSPYRLRNLWQICPGLII